MMSNMENVTSSKSKVEAVQAPRSGRAAEVRALGVQAAALSLQALKLSRMAAELARPAKGDR